MKTIIATAIALTATAPAFAESAAELFALSNDSAAERIIQDTSVGNPEEAKIFFAMQNDSAAETNAMLRSDTVTRGEIAAAERFFSMSEDSAAEIN